MSLKLRNVRPWALACCLCSLVLGGVSPARGADDTAIELLPYLSDSANVIAVIRVDKILNSARGKKEG